MKHVFLIAFVLCLSASVGKSQSLVPYWSAPNNGNSYYGSTPVITLDSLTGNLDYSFTVHNPSGTERDNFEWGGTIFAIDLYDEMSGNIATVVDVNSETYDVNDLYPGQQIYSGTINISGYYNNLDKVVVTYSNSYVGGSVNDGFNGYDEYEFIP